MKAELMVIFPGWEPHEPKFTWVDPKFTNMIAQKITRDDGSEDWEVSLIDWEFCAWYPFWTQGVQIMTRTGVALRDPTDALNFISYRKSEITSMIMKDFDPDIDQERLAVIKKKLEILLGGLACRCRCKYSYSSSLLCLYEMMSTSVLMNYSLQATSPY